MGYVRYNDGLSYTGRVYFTTYDSNNRVIDAYNTTKSGANGGSGIVKVASHGLSSSNFAKAKYCGFDISEAVRD